VAINRARKEELVAHYGELLSDTDGFIIVHTSGLTVPQVQELRAKIREAEGDYLTTKLTLFRIALQNAGYSNPEEHLQGPVSIAFGKGNFPGVAKAILDFTKGLEENLQVKGGVMTGDVLDGAQVVIISKLPSLEELRSQLAGLIIQPATGLVSVLNAATGEIVNVLQAYVQDQEGDEDAA
jgi:large subunit ribosomal protein L10